MKTFASNQRPQLGMKPKLPKKVIPGTNQNTDGTIDYSFVLSEEEKKKDDYFQLKQLVYHYEWIGRQQINRHRDSILKKFNLAYGVIDTSDYIKGSSEYSAELEMLNGEDLDYDLKFYPIVPNIINSLVGELSKTYTNYSALAVNPEAINRIVEEKNNLVRQLLLQPLQEQFDAEMNAQGITPETQPDVFQQQQELFLQMPQVQKYMAKTFRLEVENWANHTIQMDQRRFKMAEVEKQAFFNKLVTDLPFVHIELSETDYRPQILDPRYCAYLKSPYVDDVSEGIMFMWHEYESPLNLITRFGEFLSEDDVDKLQRLHIHYRTLLNINSNERYNLDVPGDIASAQNYLAFREIANTKYTDDKYRGGEYKERLVEICNMYLQVPRKLGKLTLSNGKDKFSEIVDENYKPTVQPVYDTTILNEKTERTLIYGEHVEWFYKNELWRVVKINLTTNPNPDNNDDIWVVLEKHPLQLSKPEYRFGSYIPVHGGPKTNKYNNPVTIVDKCKPWQVFYNYLWNRNDQLVKGEIGKFFLMNQNMIPQESMGEEWGRANLLKWALVARDTGIAPTDPSMMNTGSTALAATGGYGQEVDLTVTQQVIDKAKLAEICKNECLLQVGITPQFMGDISPSETATGVQQGINASVTQLKHLYDEHFSLFESVRQTMLQYAAHHDAKGNNPTKMYVSDEGERVLFQVPTDLSLHNLGVYISSNMDDNSIIQTIKTLVLQDNTMGADLLDKVTALTSKSVSEIYSKLKDLSIDKQAQETKQYQQEQNLVQQQIESQEKQLQAKLQEEATQAQLDRESNERIAEIKVIGQSSFSEGDGYEELLKLKQMQDKEKQSYNTLLAKLNQDTNALLANRQNTNITQQADKEKRDIEREKLQIDREKILADLKKSQNQLLIAKTNKNKYSK
jgi:hypothetical protein